ncbi:hypothetical protein Aasi_1670 [Candidatus Amoebophilus asiaticus 5a2]|uniref:Uncharacterized protein n=1 Tax=Amoebophilus asiaticus (strain 5a2) TaxID=452471 RepID=C3L3T0_AMOA5|nr:hypothetical protein Aasi_1670 [Candidatus Amoebophilus asiaticus 5a2]
MDIITYNYQISKSMVKIINKQVLFLVKKLKIFGLLLLCVAIKNHKVYVKEQKYDLPYPTELVE